MTAFRYVALPAETARAFQAGENDANNQPPERHISDGGGNPCRHCLADIPEGEPFLILSYRPFPALQPYAEVGPIFLHADACDRFEKTAETPPMVLNKERILMRGYGNDNRIIYGTGQVIATAEIEEAAAKLLERREVAYLHLRSSTNNCYQCRIERA